MDKKNVREIERPNLNKAIDNFCNGYYEKVLTPGWKYCSMGLNISLLESPAAVRNLIEKVAAWYEIRYPDYEIERIFSGTNYYGKAYKHTDEQSVGDLLDKFFDKYNDKNKKIDEVMFENNSYITSNFDANSDARKLSWSELLNVNAFIKSLPYKERWVFKKPKHDVSEIYGNYIGESIALGDDGKVLDANHLDKYFDYKISDRAFVGKTLDEVIEVFNENDVKVPSFIESYIDFYNARVIAREEFLNCVMYRIIDKGGSRIGPRRALLFAKELNACLFTPIMFGIDTRDPNLGIFIDEYLLAGGLSYVCCIDDYFGINYNRKDKVRIINLDDPSIRSNMAHAHTYTDVRKELYIRLMNALSNNIDPEELKTAKKEEVMRLRLERKLAKINNNK